MTLDLGRIIGRTFSICWRHRWLWLLGVFGGGGFGFRANYSGPGNGRGSTSAQVQAFLHEWLWLIIVVTIVILVVALVAFIISCIAVPAATWAGLALDAGEPATLGIAWRQGVRRFGVYLRLNLLRFAISLGVVVVVAVLVLAGVVIFAVGGRGTLLLLIPLGILVFLAVIAALLYLAFLFAWSDRMPVLTGVGAVEALRSSARLARRAWGDTLVFAIVMGVIVLGIGIGVLVAGLVVSIPGIILVVVGVIGNSALVTGIGAIWVVLIGGAVFLAGGGFAGSLVQVAYALAGRDLCVTHGVDLSPDIPVPVFAPPAGPPALPYAPA